MSRNTFRDNVLILLQSLLSNAQKVLRLETDSSDVINECIKSVRKMGR
jgi:hypothetical protein